MHYSFLTPILAATAGAMLENESPRPNNNATAFSVKTRSGLTLNVYTDGAYSLGTTSASSSSASSWLSSGQTGFHSGGTWYVPMIP